MPQIDYQQVRQRISMDAVLNVLQWKPFSRRRSELRGPCPIHGSKNPRSRSFVVDLDGKFKCFGCGAKGNQLDLYVSVSKLKLYAAAIELCRSVGIAVPNIPEQRRGARPIASRQRQQRAPAETSHPSTAVSNEDSLPFKNDEEGECTWKI